MELMKLTACTLKHTPELWAAHGSALLTYVFRLIRRDTTAGPARENSVLLAYSHLVYAQALHSVATHANEEYVSKAMVMVLRTKEGDGRRGVLRDALDLLLRTSLSRQVDPAAADAVPPTPGAAGAGPLFMRCIKMVLKEETGSSAGHMMHLWQVVLAHLDDLRPYRHHLVPYMMHSVQRLATAAQANAEARRYVPCLDIIRSLTAGSHTVFLVCLFHGGHGSTVVDDGHVWWRCELPRSVSHISASGHDTLQRSSSSCNKHRSAAHAYLQAGYGLGGGDCGVGGGTAGRGQPRQCQRPGIRTIARCVTRPGASSLVPALSMHSMFFCATCFVMQPPTLCCAVLPPCLHCTVS